MAMFSASHASDMEISGIFLLLHIDNFTACLNGYPAESVHPARHAGGNAAERRPEQERVQGGNRQTCQ